MAARPQGVVLGGYMIHEAIQVLQLTLFSSLGIRNRQIGTTQMLLNSKYLDKQLVFTQ